MNCYEKKEFYRSLTKTAEQLTLLVKDDDNPELLYDIYKKSTLSYFRIEEFDNAKHDCEKALAYAIKSNNMKGIQVQKENMAAIEKKIAEKNGS